MIDFAKLAAPFPPDRVSWRVGSTTQDKKRGMALAYLDARDVMMRLDEVCTPGGWQCHYPHAGAKTVCEIGVKVGDEWVWKADGAGDTDVEAEKGALSDSFKRAAVKWGIGRYLYDLDSPWVELEPMGKSYKIADSAMAKLRGVLGRALGPAAVPPAAPPPRPAAANGTAQAPPLSDWHTVGSDILASAKKLRTPSAITTFWKTSPDVARLKAGDPAEYARVKTGVEQHRDLLPAMVP